jgi:tryptophan synthase alpha chain
MNRIDQTFAALRATGRKGVMPFITAGYPSLDVTAAILPALQRAGAAVCEIGIPFSDPIADGPVIQASMTEALSRGIHPSDVWAMVGALRQELTIPLVAMVSYSIPFRMGVRHFIEQSQQAGFDGFIFPDLPLEESAPVSAAVRDAGLTSSLLIAPTTPDDRAVRIARASTGFVYMLARTGITGERDSAPPDLAPRVAKIRSASSLPVAVGFGISKAEHVRAVTSVADAAIVGSALVRRIGQHRNTSPSAIAEDAGQFVAELARGLSQPAAMT